MNLTAARSTTSRDAFPPDTPPAPAQRPAESPDSSHSPASVPQTPPLSRQRTPQSRNLFYAALARHPVSRFQSAPATLRRYGSFAALPPLPRALQRKDPWSIAPESTSPSRC